MPTKNGNDLAYIKIFGYIEYYPRYLPDILNTIVSMLVLYTDSAK